jgi:hypothetical protein
MQHIIWGVFVALYSKNAAEIKKHSHQLIFSERLIRQKNIK